MFLCCLPVHQRPWNKNYISPEDKTKKKKKNTTLQRDLHGFFALDWFVMPFHGSSEGSKCNKEVLLILSASVVLIAVNLSWDFSYSAIIWNEQMWHLLNDPALWLCNSLGSTIPRTVLKILQEICFAKCSNDSSQIFLKLWFMLSIICKWTLIIRLMTFERNLKAFLSLLHMWH